ncbi:MAG: hypothetical protein JWP92_3632 [Caulobacter sp.]|nr:hypothetical protein [Caulobacter sp.]
MAWGLERLGLAAGLMAIGLLAGAGSARAAPAMWLVRDADSEIYLFGSMHVLQPKVRWRTAAFDRAYARADKVWFEAQADAAPGEVEALVARYGVDPDRRLTEKLPPDAVAALKSVLNESHAPIERVDHLRPWAAAMMLSVLPMLREGYAVSAGADLTVTRQARAADKPVAAFETLEQQVKLFADLPEAVEVQYLDDVIRDQVAPPRTGVALQTAWLRGDMGRLGPLLVEAMKRDRPALYDALLKRRNLAWADRLTVEMAGSGVQLVTVGALHMTGEDGLPALMRARGFSVRRVQ